MATKRIEWTKEDELLRARGWDEGHVKELSIPAVNAMLRLYDGIDDGSTCRSLVYYYKRCLENFFQARDLRDRNRAEIDSSPAFNLIKLFQEKLSLVQLMNHCTLARIFSESERICGGSVHPDGMELLIRSINEVDHLTLLDVLTEIPVGRPDLFINMLRVQSMVSIDINYHEGIDIDQEEVNGWIRNQLPAERVRDLLDLKIRDVGLAAP